MPRITTGTAKNKELIVPDIPNIRVPQDVYKLALFSILGEAVLGAKCLDLYAGSGSFGLEALSRGAAHCTFVDEHKLAAYAIHQNLIKCGFDLALAEVHKQKVNKFVANTPDKYDLIFVDPFYDDLNHKFLLSNLVEILADGGFITFSHGKDLRLAGLIGDVGLSVVTERRFGKSYLSILKT